MKSKMLLRIGTRGSALAMRQANMVREAIAAACPDREPTLVPIKTKGDVILEVPLAALGGKGLFVKEIELALLDGLVDVAVHSMKDLPGELTPGLVIAAVPEREDPRDVLVSREGVGLIDLPPGARVGTSSLRRKAQLLRKRPDLKVEGLRGNLDTRLKKITREGLDAIVVAAAGLKRMGWHSFVTEYLPVEEFVPAIGQGALAIEAIQGNEGVVRLARSIDHRETHLAVMVERAFSRRLGGSCQIPVAAHCTVNPEGLSLMGLVVSLDGKRIVEGMVNGPVEEGEALGHRLAEELLARGADQIIREFTPVRGFSTGGPIG